MPIWNVPAMLVELSILALSSGRRRRNGGQQAQGKIRWYHGDLLTEIFHCGYSALKKVRDAVDGATKAKDVGDVAHPRYLKRFQDRDEGSGSSHEREPDH